MGLADFFQSDHDDVHNKGNLTHDALAGAVAWQAAKAWENHVAANGKPDSHAKVKEVIAGLAAAGITHLIETKGLDAYDAQKRKKLQEQAEQRLQESLSKEYN